MSNKDSKTGLHPKVHEAQDLMDAGRLSRREFEITMQDVDGIQLRTAFWPAKLANDNLPLLFEITSCPKDDKVTWRETGPHGHS